MNYKKQARQRCAIYTRKSTNHGLEQDFNSLDAQLEACKAYIESQKTLGWTLNEKSYSDGGYSGGNLNRPSLQELLQDCKDGLLDTIVVYKIDRLTRSLIDFSKLIKILDDHGVTFISVTQNFNTTTSMGRLTLNVLLSFAQFERELSSERVRDKIAASKKKGLWTGGGVPFGYSVENKALVINPLEANIVKFIFKKYLELRSVDILRKHLKKLDIQCRPVKGRTNVKSFFSRNSLYTMLRNPTYVGKTRHNGKLYNGVHESIISHDIWSSVQAVLDGNRVHQVSDADRVFLLKGLLFDSDGTALSPSFSKKGKKEYRYYISQNILQNKEGSTKFLQRLPAGEIERLVEEILRAEIVKVFRGRAKLVSEMVIKHQEIVPIKELISAGVEKIIINAKDINILMNMGSVSKILGNRLNLAISLVDKRLDVKKPYVVTRGPKGAILIKLK